MSDDYGAKLQKILDNITPNDEQSIYEAQGNILLEAAIAINATSICFNRYDAESNTTTVIRDIYTPKAKRMESYENNEGDTYDEREYPTAEKWLHDGATDPMILHADELPYGTEKQDFIEWDAYSVLYLPVRKGDTLYGYVEAWESRAKRFFREAEIDTVQQAIRMLERTL